MLRTLLLSLGLLCGTVLSAQQAVQYSLYQLNPFQYNPGYAGLSNSLEATGVFRKQWTNLIGSPTSQNVNVHLPWYYLSGGVGLSIDNDVVGAERNTSVSLTYAYNRTVGNGFLSLGVSGGLQQKSLDGSLLLAPGGIYEGGSIDHRDALLNNTQGSDLQPTLHAGIFYKGESLRIGASVQHINEPTVTLDGTNPTAVQFLRTYFVNASYRIPINDAWAVTPSALTKSDAIQTIVEVMTLVDYEERIFGGVSYRGFGNSNSLDAIVLLAGLDINENFRLAYGYDIGVSQLNTTHNGSHEVMLRYNLNKVIGAGKLPPIIYQPRFL